MNEHNFSPKLAIENMDIDLIWGEACADQQCVSLNYNMILLETLSILCED